jgi:ferritin-like metal-binding protein YciE
MSAPKSLDDIYADELKDLWSANDQMHRALKKIAPKAQDPKLQQMLEKSMDGISRHTDVLKALLADQGEKASKEHCKGMEGLVEEAKAHILDDGPDDKELRDVLIIAQYQRMTHYGIAGFGTAAAYAKALGLEEHVQKLDTATAEIYGGDEYGTLLAERTVNVNAADA